MLIPLVGFEWFENFGREGSIHNGADLPERSRASRRKNLYRDIP
jgi:hypothetical protein